MSSEELNTHNHTSPSPGKVLYIVGPVRLQNLLMASFLREPAGAHCLILENLSKLPKKDANSNGQTNLVLWDCFGKNAETFLTEHESNRNRVSSEDLMALFNVVPGLGIEEKVITCGVQGFFYEEDSLERLSKGVRALFNGEIWISRKLMAAYLKKNNHQNPQVGVSKKAHSMLTLRETEILALIATGATNVEAAERLRISPLTVKTHLRNIFKKINVPNRLQAALWAEKNL